MVGRGVLVATIGFLAYAAQDRPGTFEVASVKLNTSGSSESSTQSSRSQIFLKNVSLKQTIETAFDVKDYSLSGPGWLDSVRFDVVAKLPPGGANQIKPALRALLAERFHLSTHREPKLMSAYALTIDKKGPRLQAAKPGVPGASSGRGMLKARSISMPQFADLLSTQLDRPVQDFTALEGVFKISLAWTPDDSPAGEPAAGHEGKETADTPIATSIFGAIREQLGLKLEARKLPVEILVVDHVGKVPTEN